MPEQASMAAPGLGAFTWRNKSKVGEVIGHRPPVLDRKVGDVLYKGNAALWLYLSHHAKVQDADLAVRRPQLQSMLAVSRQSGNEPLQASASPAGTGPSLMGARSQRAHQVARMRVRMEEPAQQPAQLAPMAW